VRLFRCSISSGGGASSPPELASELVRLKVDVIATFGTPTAQAAKPATSTIRIVMALSGDPIGTGTMSLAPPGGNITSVINLGPGTAQKRLELLKEAVPIGRLSESTLIF
jgi:putative ABC transport system substrate-binding protein